MRTATIFSLAGLLMMAGCSTSPNTTAATAGNSDLEQTIRGKLATDPAVSAANLSVSADAGKNQATLSGTVSSEDVRTKAVDLAKSAQPDLVVTDKIDVKPPEVSRNDYTEDMANQTREKAKQLGNRVGRSLDDAWIYSKIVTRLATDPDTSALKVNVDVNDKVVTLRGRVDTPLAKTEAERLAKDTDGVKSVRDLIIVSSAG